MPTAKSHPSTTKHLRLTRDRASAVLEKQASLRVPAHRDHRFRGKMPSSTWAACGKTACSAFSTI